MNFLTVSLIWLGLFFGLSLKSNSFTNPTSQKSSLLKDSTVPKIKIDLAKAKTIEVLTLEKEISGDGSDTTNQSKCKNWNLSKQQLSKIIREFKSMSSEAQDWSYLYWPCRIKGDMKIDNMKFNYWVNAGSTMTLRNNDTTLYFGCPRKMCSHFFLSGKIKINEQ